MAYRRLFLLVILLLLVSPTLIAQDNGDYLANAGPISYDQTISVNISEEIPLVSYVFSASAGDVVTITSISPDNSFDSFLRLFDAEGNVLAENDDSGGTRDSRIEGFEIPAGGEYAIVVTSYVYYRTGQYRAGAVEVSLTAESTAAVQNEAEATPEATEEATPEATSEPTATEEATAEVESTTDESGNMSIEASDEPVEITYGTQANGTLTEDIPTQPFIFSATQGDRVTIALEGDFDTLLVLQNPDGREIETDDDGGVETNSLITDFVIPASGDYTILASSYEAIRQGGAVAGSYTLRLDGGSAPVVELIEPETITLSYGDTVEGELTESTPYALYTFDASAGDVVSMSVDGDFDSIMFVEDENGNELAFDDDGGGDRNPLVENLEITVDGPVIIRVDSYRNNRGDGAVTGTFTLSLYEGAAVVVQTEETTPTPDESGLIPITYGESVTGELTEEVLNLKYRFTASAGDVVTIDLSGDFDTFMFIYDLDGNELGRNDDDEENDGSSRLENLTIPADGDYIIQADSYGNQRLNDPARGGTFTLEVTLVDSGAVVESEEIATPEPTEEATAEATEVPTEEPEETVTPEATRAPEPTGETVVIASGETIEGVLSEDYPAQEVEFTASEGDLVTINLMGVDDFDAYLFLLNAEGEIIAEDDDGGEERDASITRFALPTGGTYTIIATTYNNAMLDEPTTGTFSLSLLIESGDEVVTVPEAEPEAINYGDSINGELTLTQPSRQYVFSATEGDVVSILLEADIDGYLFLLDAEGEQLAQNDDGGGDLNSLIEGYTIPADGDYIIQVDSYGNARLNDPREGTYKLTVTLDEGTVVEEDTDEAIGLVAGEVLTVGDTVTDEFNADNPNREYKFNASAGEVVVIDLNSELDTYLFVLDAEGNILVEDDDSGEGFNAQIVFEAAEDGTYTIVADTYANSQTDQPTFGAFSLSLSEEGAQQQTDTDTTRTGGESLAVGETVTGELSQSQPDETWVFQASAGDTIVLMLASDEFDAYLLLYDADGNLLAESDDDAGDLNSRIGPFTIPVDGEYTVVASSYGYEADGDPESGDYTLSLNTAQIDVIEYGEVVEGQISLQNNYSVLQFTGSGGDLIAIDLQTSSNELRLTLETSDGEFIDATYGDFEDMGPTLLPYDGDYTITVDSYDVDETLSFSLRVSRLEIQPTELNTNIDVTISGIMQAFSFEGNEGDTISITVNSNNAIDTTLRLIDPDGYFLAEDLDGGPGLDPELYRVVLPTTGTYALGVIPVIEDSSGDLILNITKVVAPSLDEGAQSIRLTGETNQGSVSFTAASGETVYLSVQASSGTPENTSIRVVQDGSLLANNTLGRGKRVIIEVTAINDSTVTVVAENYDYMPVILELELIDLGE